VRKVFTQQSVALHVTPCSVVDLYQCLVLPLSLGIFTLTLETASSYKHWNLLWNCSVSLQHNTA